MEKEVRNSAPETREVSYEQLKNFAHQMSNRVQELTQKNEELIETLNHIDMSNLLKRLEWLWTITMSTNPYITEDFKVACGNEFMALMAKPEEPKGE